MGEHRDARATVDQSRQTFVPDASRIFEDIERNGGEIRAKADYHFIRAVPAGGYTKGLAQAQRTDVGDGDISAEELGVDFFPYGPLNARAGRPELARAANVVQRALATGRYAGAIWLEGRPTIEDTVYWLSLMVDTHGAAGRQRGPSRSRDRQRRWRRHILDAIDFIVSKGWADDGGEIDWAA